ncbi:restriction endonuclease subunit S [Natribaculum luteum]|uniref:Restriction endonuclease subunit S n=1 Tax=Natribaculum luteum TaxID=1586232 RepID=A0ABD5P602_9EURY|nr:restriction endonuclease subunit S [Natribaculum luteum]
MNDEATLDEFVDGDVSNSEEWIVRSLGELAEYQNGNAFSKSEWGDEGYPIIRIQNLTGEQDEFNYFDGDLERRYEVEAGDTLLSWSATIDVFQWSGPKAALNQHIFRVDTSGDVNDTFYRFKLEHLLPRLIALSHGSTMQHVRKADLVNVDANIPPLPEQRKIATVLQTVDRAIEKTEKLIEQKKRLRDAVAQESLVLETNSYTRPTEWGRIPESWEEKTLEEVCRLITDGTHMPPERTETGIPLIGVDEIDGIQLDFSGDLSYISEEDYQEMSESNKPNEGDVLVAVVGATIGKSAIVTRQKQFAIQRSLGLLRTNESVLPRFLHTVVQSPNFKRQLDTRSRATAQAGVYLEELKRVRIPVPPIEVQEDIADRVDEITYSIRNENEYLSSLKRLKQGLMQDLLSGEVRTTDTNIEVPEEITQHG